VEFFEHTDLKLPEPKTPFSVPEKQCSELQALNLGMCSEEQGSVRFRFEPPVKLWQMQKVLLKG
jgi:hypothetical protein